MDLVKKFDQNVDPFTPNQKIWLLDNKPTEVDQIRGGLTPEVLTCGTYDNLIENISSRLSMSDDAYGTLIISENLPNDVRSNYDNLIRAINSDDVINRIFIFQIIDQKSSPFVRANTYQTIQEFLDAANNIHLEQIVGNQTLDDQARQIIRQLTNSKNQYQARYEQEVQDNHKLSKQLEETKSNFEQNQAKIAYFEQKIDEADEKSAKADQLVSDNKQKIQNLVTGLDQARVASNQDKDKIIELEAKVEGSNRTIKEISTENNQLNLQIQDLQSQIGDITESNRKLLQAKTDAEGIGEMQNQINAYQDKIAALTSSINELKQSVVFKDAEITRLQTTNDEIRSGYRDYSQVGYSNVFQEIELSKTNIMYFKIIEDLPFHRFYIERIADIMRKIIPASIHIVTVMMKVDQGNDRARFSDRTFIGNLNGITESHDKYYLIPSKRMGEEIEQFERQNVIVLFLDYIDNSKYYIETHGLIDYYFVCKNSRIGLQDYDAKGLPISYDHHSIMNIKYNQALPSMTTENQNKYFDNIVQQLITDSKIVEANYS